MLLWPIIQALAHDLQIDRTPVSHMSHAHCCLLCWFCFWHSLLGYNSLLLVLHTTLYSIRMEAAPVYTWFCTPDCTHLHLTAPDCTCLHPVAPVFIGKLHSVTFLSRMVCHIDSALMQLLCIFNNFINTSWDYLPLLDRQKCSAHIYRNTGFRCMFLLYSDYSLLWPCRDLI